jgi:hypothetical protein
MSIESLKRCTKDPERICTYIQSKTKITSGAGNVTSHRTRIRSPSSSTTARQSSRGSLLSTRRQTSATILSLDSISKQHCLRKESNACATCNRALDVTTWHPAMITGHVKLQGCQRWRVSSRARRLTRHPYFVANSPGTDPGWTRRTTVL